MPPVGQSLSVWQASMHEPRSGPELAQTEPVCCTPWLHSASSVHPRGTVAAPAAADGEYAVVGFFVSGTVPLGL